MIFLNGIKWTFFAGWVGWLIFVIFLLEIADLRIQKNAEEGKKLQKLKIIF